MLAERNEPPLRDGVSAHALRKTYFTFLHESGAPPRWVADQGGHADPSTSLRIYTESLRGRSEANTARPSTSSSTAMSAVGPIPLDCSGAADQRPATAGAGVAVRKAAAASLAGPTRPHGRPPGRNRRGSSPMETVSFSSRVLHGWCSVVHFLRRRGSRFEVLSVAAPIPLIDVRRRHLHPVPLASACPHGSTNEPRVVPPRSERRRVIGADCRRRRITDDAGSQLAGAGPLWSSR